MASPENYLIPQQYVDDYLFVVEVFFVETTRRIDSAVATLVATSTMEVVRLNVLMGKEDGMNLLHPMSDFFVVVTMVKPSAAVDVKKLVGYCYYHDYSM